MAARELARFEAAVVGVHFGDFCGADVSGELVFLRRDPPNAYDPNSVDVRLKRNGLLLGHLEANLATILSTLLRSHTVAIDG